MASKDIKDQARDILRDIKMLRAMPPERPDGFHEERIKWAEIGRRSEEVIEESLEDMKRVEHLEETLQKLGEKFGLHEEIETLLEQCKG